MTAEKSSVAAPPWAITMWCDLQRVYVQLPSINGPCVLAYPRDARGIGEVLALMQSRHTTERAGDYHLPVNPLAKMRVPLAPNSREMVREMLRKKGVLGR